MTDLSPFGRTLIFIGLAIVAVGFLMTVAGRIPLLGRLPGDIAFQRGNFSFYFPIVTSILLSLVLTLVLNLFTRR